MAKRFSDSEKWNKKFIRSLKPNYKLFWLFLLDECNHAGIWDVDIEVAGVKMGVKITEEAAIKAFGEKVWVIDGGLKWFIPGFIEFQYGQLSEQNRAHAKPIFLLRKFELLDENLLLISPFGKIAKPLSEKPKAPMDMDIEQEEDKEQEKEMEQEEVKAPPPKNNFLVKPFESPEFLELWANWKVYKKKQHQFEYKAIQSEQAALKELAELSNYNEELATKIIHQSIAKGWKGFFKLKENEGTTKNGQSVGELNASYKRRLEEKMANGTG